MAGRRPQPPSPVVTLSMASTGDPASDRVNKQAEGAIQALQEMARRTAGRVDTLESASAGGGAVADADYGDVIVTASGTVWTVDQLPESRIVNLTADLAAKVPTTRTITAGTGLAGGGDLSADRTISLANTAVAPASYTYGSFTVDAQGRLTAASSGAAPVVATRVLTTTAPLRIDAGASADLSADRTLSVSTFTTGASGVVPASSAGTNFLHGDATWRTPTQVKSDLAIAAGDVSGLAAIATSGSASDLTTGTLPDARFPALTGDVTTVAGALATTIAADAVTNAKLADMAANTVKANLTGGAANPTDSTLSDLVAALVSNGALRFHDLGDGSDGTPDLDGVNTFTWATLAASTYTLTRPVFWAGATIRSGITIKPDGWSIRSNANIANAGDVNVNGNAAAAGIGGVSTWTSNARDLPGGLGGANSGGSGAASANAPQVFSTTAANGGAAGTTAGQAGSNGTAGGIGHGSGGGGGGAALVPGAGTAGGNSGAVTLNAVTAAGLSYVLEYMQAITARTRVPDRFTIGSASGAGSSGGGVGAGAGGASGGNAGWMTVIALSISGAGTWRAKGGAGQNGVAATGVGGGGGGGSGGCGGIIALRVCTGAYPTTDVTGGTAGNAGGAGGGGGGAGGAGQAGGAGYYIKL